MPEQSEAAATRLDAQQVQGVTNQRAAEVAIEDASILRVAGQRHINARWELTQAVVAISVTLVTLGVCAFMAVWRGSESALNVLGNAFFFVIGAYFQRTNHQKIGGVGVRDEGR
jgi:hypothetical protein